MAIIGKKLTVSRKIKCIDIEIAVAKYFSWRANLIVPNVSWGMSIHECDLLIVTPAGYCYEVEIKISRSDLKADRKKMHGHQSNMIKELYFAIPDYLSDCIGYIPERSGILTVSEYGCRCIRIPQILPARKLSEKERYQIARLGTMRIWKLKKAIQAHDNEQKSALV